jgi:hypothetical protein
MNLMEELKLFGMFHGKGELIEEFVLKLFIGFKRANIRTQVTSNQLKQLSLLKIIQISNFNEQFGAIFKALKVKDQEIENYYSIINKIATNDYHGLIEKVDEWL